MWSASPFAWCTHSISASLSCRCQLVECVCAGVRGCVCVSVQARVCVFSPPPPGLISIWSVARPEHDTEGQWVSWNSCGRKPSSYAIRSGYDNTFVYMLRCVCVFCESQLSNLWLWLSFGKVPCILYSAFVFFMLLCFYHYYYYSVLLLLFSIIIVIIQYYNFVGVFVKRALSFQWLSVSRGDCFLGSVQSCKLVLCCRMPGKPAVTPLCHRWVSSTGNVQTWSVT